VEAVGNRCERLPGRGRLLPHLGRGGWVRLRAFVDVVVELLPLVSPVSFVNLEVWLATTGTYRRLSMHWRAWIALWTEFKPM
jgi:hypothetical protein